MSFGTKKRIRGKRIWSTRESGTEKGCVGERRNGSRRGKRSERRSQKWNRRESDDLAQVSPLL